MTSRILPLLRLLIVVAIVGIVVVAGALLKLALAGDSGAPRTEAERAALAAEEAVKANPNDANARIKLAAAYLEEGSISQAVDQANVAVRLKPKDPSPYYVLGLAYSKAGNRQGAITALTKATTMDGQLAPFYQDANVALAQVYDQAGDSAAALSAMNKAISYGAEDATLLVARGQMYEHAKKWFDAAVDYSWALQYVPDLGDTRAALDKIKQDHPVDYKKAVAQVAAALASSQPAGEKSTVPTAP